MARPKKEVSQAQETATSETQELLNGATASKKPKGKVSKKVDIAIPPIKVAYIDVPIVGTEDVGVHQWSDKARKEMRDKQMQKPQEGKKEVRNPFRDFLASMYMDPPMGGLTNFDRGMKMTDEEFRRDFIIPGPHIHYYFPLIGFKKAIVSACRQLDGVSMTFARGAIHIIGDKDDKVEIFGVPYMKEHMVRLPSSGSADLRYRGFFPHWCAKLRVKYIQSNISAEQVVNLVNLAGFSVGIGEWRPEKDGFCGTFEVVDESEFNRHRIEIEDEWKLAERQWEKWIAEEPIPMGGRIAA